MEGERRWSNRFVGKEEREGGRESNKLGGREQRRERDRATD